MFSGYIYINKYIYIYIYIYIFIYIYNVDMSCVCVGQKTTSQLLESCDLDNDLGVQLIFWDLNNILFNPLLY